MRKIILVFLVLIMIPVIAISEQINISALSIEELIRLRNEIDNRINEILYNENDILYSGTYIVGKDIEPGAYLFTLIKSSKKGSGLLVFTSYEGYKNYDYYNQEELLISYEEGSLDEGEIIHLRFSDGEFLILGFGEYSLRKIGD